jgi:hypothetical protein
MQPFGPLILKRTIFFHGIKSMIEFVGNVQPRDGESITKIQREPTGLLLNSRVPSIEDGMKRIVP